MRYSTKTRTLTGIVKKEESGEEQGRQSKDKRINREERKLVVMIEENR